MGKTLHFVMLFVGICVVFAGVGGFLTFRDYSYHYQFVGQSDTYPSNSRADLGYYDQLSTA